MRRACLGVASRAFAAPVSAPTTFSSAKRWNSDDTTTTDVPARREVPPPADPADPDQKKLQTNDFYVGGGSSVNKLAGAVCYALRDYESAGMRCIGPRAVNQAVKATAVARSFLAREEKGVIGRIENARVVSYERTTQSMPKLGAHILMYHNNDVIEVQEREDERILTVAARTLPRNLAAAIKVWADVLFPAIYTHSQQNIGAGRNVTVRAVGPEAVENCALGVGFARNYCKQDEEVCARSILCAYTKIKTHVVSLQCDYDIGFVTEFTNLGEGITGMSSVSQ